MSQQTAMQILWDWIDANCHEDNFNINDARDMSLKLEKEQIIKTYNNAISKMDYFIQPESAEQYYNETYNQ